MREGEFLMPFGTPGGDVQPQAMLQVFLNIIVFGMDIQQAVEAPRFATHSFPDSFEPHPYYPGRLDLERASASRRARRWARVGHRVDWLPDLSIAPRACARSRPTSKAASLRRRGPRRTGRAMGW